MTDPDIQPNEELTRCIHVPWPDNSAEDYVYHAHFTTSNNEYRTKRVNGTTITDISPSDGTRSYSPRRQVFSITTFDSDRRYVLVVGEGNDTGTSSNIKFAAFVSDDYGDSWTRITEVFDQADSVRPLAGAFSGDTRQAIYLWGQSGYISYSQDFGATVDDRNGNIDTDWTPGDFIGIAGGG
jgi:photosystem II stability/assembly factor-like uncharacterized protein